MSKEQGTKRLEIKPTQVTAGALASVTAAVLGSKLGVAGTITGAGLASVVGTVGTAMYERSIQAARSRVTARIRTDEQPPVGASHDAETVRLMVAPPKEEEAGKRRWPMMVAAVAVAFVLGMGVLTGVELLNGHATAGNGDRTTVGALFGQSGQGGNSHPTSTPPPTTTETTTSSTTPTTTSSTPPSSTSTSTSTSTSPSTTTTTTTSQQLTDTSGNPPPGAN